MYIPASNAEHRPDVIHDFIQAHPLGALVTGAAGSLLATHLPLVLYRDRGAHGVLHGHLARANPQSRVASPCEALVIFTGAEAYVSPSWYASKREHGKVVPTWNYVAVHAYVTLRLVDDAEFLNEHLHALTSVHEGAREQPWSVSDAPADYIEQQQRAIIGVELEITRLEGKWKMSQNRPAADIDGVIRGLEDSPRAMDRETAAIVAARRPSAG